MKPLSYSLIAAALACGFANAQTTAYTTPVGYFTSYISANASNNVDSGAATFISSSLVRPTTYAGAATASPSGGNTIALAAGVPTDLDSTYVLEITDGPSEGWWSAVTGSTGVSITINDAFPAGLAANVKVSVRKFTTIKDVFGANTPGLTGLDFIDTLPHPEVIPQETVPIVWNGVDAWIDPVTEANADSTIIWPGTAVKVVHFDQASTLAVVVSGEVKLTKTQVDIYPAANWLGQPLATGGTLGSMGFGTQILTTDGLSIFEIDTGSGAQATSYYVRYVNAMIDPVLEENRDSVPIGSGGGYLIDRLEGEAASVITIPAQVVAP